MTQPAGHDDFADPDGAPAQDVAGMSEPDSTRILETIRGCVGEQNFQHWFLNRAHAAVQNDQLKVFVPNPFILNWLQK
ncbi:MAG: hypothetical protein KDA96_28215, partial [Planctomycetaceae bacterium]|nr:hypothetical protein [Planctomycetaceae bacterium]